MFITRHFDEERALALAALFLRRRGGEMKHLKLVKLMYLADREALKRWGHSITGDRYVSMKYGPVLSTVLDLIHEEAPGATSAWGRHIVESAPHTVKLVEEFPSDSLSQAEEELAEEIFREYGKMNRWKLVDLTHGFPEFKKPDECTKRWELPHADVLVAVGKTPSVAKSICDDKQDRVFEHSLLSVE